MRSNYNHIKMKKLVYLLAAGSMAFVACQNSPSYKVTGSVEDITDGDTIYLQEYAGGNLVKLDSAIVKSGTFVFTGKQDTAVNRYITYMKGDKRYFTDLFLENGNINVTLGKESKVSGTPNNDAYQSSCFICFPAYCIGSMGYGCLFPKLHGKNCLSTLKTGIENG